MFLDLLYNDDDDGGGGDVGSEWFHDDGVRIDFRIGVFPLEKREMCTIFSMTSCIRKKSKYSWNLAQKLLLIN